jgi:5'-nucleotidase/UDP-sugar diphosphatase
VPSLRQLSIPWNEPMPWTFVLVVVLLAILGFHNRIAREIGTAAPPTEGTVAALSTAANPPVGLVSSPIADAAEAGAPLPNRAPRDPFQALVSAAGARVPAVALPIGKAHSHAAPHHKLPQAPLGDSPPASHGSSPAAPTGTHPITSHDGSGASSSAGSGQCAAVHVVKAGESLWSIAQQHVNVTGHGHTAKYWHRIYSANHQLIGANPSQLSIGLHLCLPAP